MTPYAAAIREIDYRLFCLGVYLETATGNELNEAREAIDNLLDWRLRLMAEQNQNA